MNVKTTITHDEARNDLGLSGNLSKFKDRIGAPLVYIYAAERNASIRPFMRPLFCDVVHMDIFAPDATNIINTTINTFVPYTGLYARDGQIIRSIFKEIKKIILEAKRLIAVVYMNARPPGHPARDSEVQSMALLHDVRSHVRGMFLNADITPPVVRDIMRALAYCKVEHSSL